MKNFRVFFVFVFVVLSLHIYAQERRLAGPFVIHGQVLDTSNGIIYMQQTDSLNKRLIIDSCVIANGRFSFRGILREPKLITIYSKEVGRNRTRRYSLFLESDTVEIYCCVKKDSITVRGSKTHEIYDLFNKLSYSYNKSIDSLTYLSAKYLRQKDTLRSNSLDKQIEMIQDSLIRKIYIPFVKKYSGSPVAVLVMWRLLSKTKDVKDLKVLYNGLNSSLKGLPAVKEFIKQVNLIEITAIGKKAPLFNLSDTSNVEIKAATFRGKHVLLHFWASWHRESKKHFVEYKQLYQQYSNKNFTIISVSLDDGRQTNSWVNAVNELAVPWYQVIANKGWQSDIAETYRIRTLPSNILIDKNGFIVAKNVTYNELKKNLSKL